MPVLFFVVGLFCGAAQGFFWDSGNEPAVWEAPGGFRFADTHFPAPLAAQSSPAEGADSWPWGSQKSDFGPLIVFAVGIVLFLVAYLFVRSQPSTKKRKKKKII